MLINIGADEFYKYFPEDPHPFLSKKFVDLNKGKVNQILMLVEDTQNPLLGIIVGVKNGHLFSPFSAPFGGFHFNNELIFTSVIYNFLEHLKRYIIDNKLKDIQITMPPDIYSPTINSKFINGLINCRFNITSLDITSWVNLTSFKQQFSNSKARQYLNKSKKNGLQFKLTTNLEEKRQAYEIIKENRTNLNRPIYMSFDDLEKINSIWGVDYYIVTDKHEEKLASAIVYRAHQSIVYAVFWGDNEKGRSLRAMNFTIFNLYNYYKQSDYKYMDIGISTEKGIPNEGLIWFKESHDAISSLRYTLKWVNDQENTIQKTDEAMKSIKRYGIILRTVDVGDAEFIYELRSNTDLNRFISYTSPQINDQIQWIKEYKIREKSGLEYYYIAEDQQGNKYGTIRLYNLDEKSFEIGSWLFNHNSPIGMAVKAHFIGFEIGFEVLKAQYCRFEIRKKNRAVLRYMQDFETSLVGDDNLNFYFTLSKENFYKRRAQLSIFSKDN